MKFKFIDWYSWFIVSVVFGSIVGLILYSSSGVSSVLSSCVLVFGSYFVCDMVGFYLSLLSILLLFILLFVYNFVTGRSKFYVFISVVSSLLCYCSNNIFLFWWFYEVSILSLLFLLIVESPYSERYLAGWYLGGYIVLTSLPMLLCLFYFSCVSGSFFMSDWLTCDYLKSSSLSSVILVLLGILFVTKIPVFPFHSWLPIVHAEATSLVSVCLSGYVMKLGILGVCRFCWWVAPDYLFSLFYVSLSFFFSILFFLVASWELDGKRWLAFLSLSHIVICVVCLNGGLYDSCGLLFVYSLGHGLSAGLVFVLLWWGYELSGSRNWMILKFIFGGSLFFRFLLGLGLCTVASLPPIVQFFVEVSMLSVVSGFSVSVFVIFCFYLFFSSLVPLFVLGLLVSRHFCFSYNSGVSFLGFSSCLLFVLFWSYILFLVA
uniref:NADH-ubiquinone oxidoreductase chain 4 n=1 Tax=Apharyngostrigea pipientis TaxID=234879 RepID=A0A8A2H9S1_9TREM|nr:NADH dehydrogenase subunit 4 [Apharyngostrigea pipientis]QSV37700.1 NADH dehydrogenase subunit 4 [Apharyngostrigea pipientis]